MRQATPGPATGLIPRFETINALLAAIQSRHRPPAEVAYALNFSDPANFGRFFKKHTGQTLLDYRKAMNS